MRSRRLAPRASLAVVLLVLGGPVLAAGQEPAAPPAEAAVRVWNREIAVLRAARGGREPAARAARAVRVLRGLSDAALVRGVTVTRIDTAEGPAYLFEIDGQVVLGLLEGDVEPESGDTLDALARRTEERLRGAIASHFEQSSWRRLGRAGILALVATLLYAGLVWILVRGRHLAARRLVAASRRSVERASRAGFDLWRYAFRLIHWLVNALAWLIGAIATYLWLSFVLFQFPYTQPWGEALGGWLLDLVETIGSAVIHAIPDLAIVGVILLIANGLTRLVSQIFRGVAMRGIRLSWLRPETAEATRRIGITLVWVFAIALAYPYIPGSSSTAFQGISVLLGVMISLGSASLVNHAMSGLVVVYSRAFRAGDFVRIGETEGVVLELGALSSKLLTPGGEVTIPHGVVVSGAVTNHTQPAREAGGGSLISVSVTIGYDAPWRQVHALLLEAAARTPGMRSAPEPYVLQRALSDFYVAYQLVAHAERPERTLEVLSELHQRIQDGFNEHGVQILSPHFALQPPQPAVVPREKWYTPPAAPPQPEASG
jgi:small-conductance mechanosensitive channel